ncbi:MAG: hypothetical protein LBH38_03715 [Holosporales bacterium]|jgi:methionyl-tRNA formyltransferase|nr:hypothetical protein [Holosporales bacterium]
MGKTLSSSTIYVLTKKSEDFDRIVSIGKRKSPNSACVHCSNIHKLRESVQNLKEGDVLLSFSIGEIVPVSILSLFKTAINVHPASPDYPGRDAHFYAAYDGVTQYGATAHIMTPRVDEGQILDVELIPVEKSSGMGLLSIANACAFTVIERLFAAGFQKNPGSGNVVWGIRKTKRVDLLDTCKIFASDSKEEVERKFRAFQEGAPFKNLYIDIYGFRFRFEDVIIPPHPGRTYGQNDV